MAGAQKYFIELVTEENIAWKGSQNPVNDLTAQNVPDLLGQAVGLPLCTFPHPDETDDLISSSGRLKLHLRNQPGVGGRSGTD